MVRLFLSLIGSLMATNAMSQAQYTLNLRGVELSEVGEAFVSVELQCGEQVKGILVREGKDSVGIGAIIARPNVICSTSPVTHEISLNFLTSHDKELTSLPSDEGDHKISFQEVEVASSSTKLQVSWEDNCRKFLGVVFSPVSPSSVEVAAVFAPASKESKKQGCQSGKKSADVSLNNQNQVHFSSLRKPTRVNDIYALHVTAPTEVNINAQGQLVASYLRTCKEVPVGILSTGVAGLKIGVVTAYFPNRACDSKQKIDSTMSLPVSLAVSRNVEFTAISLEQASLLNKKSYVMGLESPLSAKFSKTDMRLESQNTSGTSFVGKILGQDQNGNLSIADLKIQSVDGKIKNKLSVQMTPFHSASMLTPKIFPLKIRGSMVR